MKQTNERPERPKGWNVTKETRHLLLNERSVTADIEAHTHVGCSHVAEWSYTVSRHDKSSVSELGMFVRGYARGKSAARKLAEKHAFDALQGKPRPPKPKETKWYPCPSCAKKSPSLEDGWMPGR
jgi:hypothetical protein